MVIAEAIQKNIDNKQPFFSLEFFPPKNTEDFPSFFSTVNELKKLNPLFVSVTYGAGGTTCDSTLAITTEMAQQGLLPMAHLTCVGATKEKVHSYLSQLDSAGVTSVLALRGDQPKNSEHYDWNTGEFVYALDLVRFVRKEFPHFSVSVAGYPTPHPESPSYVKDRKFAADKLDESDFAITQLFFDPRDYFEYLRFMRQLGIDKPVIPGILPIQSLDSIKRILLMSGGNIPAKLYVSLENAYEKGGNEAVKETAFTFAVEQVKRLIDGGAPGVHLYTLNKAEMCLKIAEAIGPL